MTVRTVPRIMIFLGFNPASHTYPMTGATNAYVPPLMMNTNPTSMGVSPNCGAQNLKFTKWKHKKTHTITRAVCTRPAIRTYGVVSEKPKFLRAPSPKSFTRPERLLTRRRPCVYAYFYCTRRVCSNKLGTCII